MRHLAVGLALVSVVATAATAQTAPNPPPVAVIRAWARATAGAASTGAAYMTVTVNGQPDHLIGASTPLAAAAELHQTSSVDGVMRMRPIPDLSLAPGQPVTFTPGGYHLMLMGLRQPLRKGDTFPLTLMFAHARPVTVRVEVAGLGAAEPMPDMPMPDMPMPGMPGMETGASPP